MTMCWPSDATKAQCFAGFPNNGAHSMSMMSWLLPSDGNDSYVVNGVDGFDTVDFTVDKIQQDPKYICQ